MTAVRMARHTWSRVGVAVSVGLVVFGVIDAALPRQDPAETQSSAGAVAGGVTAAVNGTDSGRGSARNFAAQRVAEQFVMATHTTDTIHPEGDVAEEAMLAPHLDVLRHVPWPEAWMAEYHRTTVALDPPGPALGVGVGKMVVLVTGRMFVSTDAGPSTEVPVAQRITLRWITPSRIAQSRLPLGGTGSGWIVIDVGTDS